MLLGTFQEIPYDNYKDLRNGKTTERHICLPSQVPRGFSKELGFAPVWAFPITDVKSTTVHALFTAPNIPQMFYIVDTDDYVRINKVTHYNLVRGDDNITLSDCIDPEADDMHSEFCIKPEALDKPKSIVFLYNIPDFAFGRIPFSKVYPAVESGIQPEQEASMREVLKTLPAIETPEQQGIEDWEYAGHEQELFYERISYYYPFVHVFLPWITAMYQFHGADLRWLYSGSHNVRKLLDCSNQFTRWSDNEYECDLQTYNRLFKEAMKYVIDQPDILWSFVTGKKIYPNDPCPCGSGKKFKKCHGRYV